MGLVTTKIGGLWVAKQSARGTAASTAIKRARQVTGNVRTARSDGKEQFSNDDRFGDAQHFVDSIIGDGDPGMQAQPGFLAYLLYLFAGQETVTGSADPWTHVATPASAGGFWATVWKKVGVSPDIIRERFADCKIGQVVIEGSTGQKVVRVTATIPSLDPGEKIASDPVKVVDVDEAFLYTEGESAFKIDTAVIRAQSQFNITIGENLAPIYTDSVVPLELVPGDPVVTVALTLALNTDGLAIYNKQVYNDPAPAAGTKPVHALPALGAYEFLLTKSANRTFKFELPGVKWTPDAAIAPNPSGGLTEVSLAGEFRAIAGQPPWKATVLNGDAAYS